MIITINGADGSGKGVIVNALSRAGGGNVQHCHSRPANLVRKPDAEKQAKYVNRPNAAPKYAAHLQMAKLLLFWCEYQAIAIWHLATGSRNLLLLERSLADLCAHPVRYGLEDRIVRRLRFFLREWYADLNICLTGDAHVLADRKKELEAAEITELNARYRAVLGRSKRKFLLVDTTENTPAESVARIMSHPKMQRFLLSCGGAI